MIEIENVDNSSRSPSRAIDTVEEEDSVSQMSNANVSKFSLQDEDESTTKKEDNTAENSIYEKPMEFQEKE